MKAYSVDFRQKIVDTYFNEKISIAKVAERFCVAKSFVQKIIKQWRETGDLNPRKSTGGQQLKGRDSDVVVGCIALSV
jgi:transposase